ncbi:MAG: peptide chain release factor N(5)-glutamine methyltransferase [Propionibacteriaceae bacterium]|jgi:release factor glutamine methyltransferase|nr:peptide chain release factor N(5)-glutamine methyltransferase [Propionibacteriaceae bacterium]
MRPNAVLTRGINRLSQAGLPSPAADARFLLAHVLDVAPVSLTFIPDVPLDAIARYDQLLELRAARHPVQHLTGIAYFRNISVQVGSGVFIPRPETEGLVQLVLDWITKRCWQLPVVICDLGTGSGVIAKSLSSELAAADIVAHIHAAELSETAYRYAVQNLATSGVDLRLADFTTAFPDLIGMVDVVVSNPPYVPTTVRQTLPSDVINRDPDMALFSGDDGLDALRAIAGTAVALLRPDGLLALEHDDSQGCTAPAALMTVGGFDEIVEHSDLADRPRYVTARRIGT